MEKIGNHKHTVNMFFFFLLVFEILLTDSDTRTKKSYCSELSERRRNPEWIF